jgi:ferric-chelate reductase
LTIINAPPSISVSSDFSDSTDRLIPGIYLAARNCGDWTGALNLLAQSDLVEDKFQEEKTAPNQHDGQMTEVGCCAEPRVFRRISVMLDGPYGGSSVDFTASEHVLFVAGGAGATFTLGLLDDTVGRIVRGRRGGARESRLRTRRITYVWCIRSYGESHSRL